MISQNDNTIERIKTSWIMAKNAKAKVNYGMLSYKLKIELIQNATIEPQETKG
jgi:hypothetical protein